MNSIRAGMWKVNAAGTGFAAMDCGMTRLPRSLAQPGAKGL
jgi:hypothetical protein